MKTISIVTACYNEEENVEEVSSQVRAVMSRIGKYPYEHIFIDNHSEDRTVEKLKEIAERDKNIKIIVNSRNFGQIRSPLHAVFQARGDAIVSLVADLQDPPEMIADFIREWENGYQMVLAVKTQSKENPLMYWIRTKYYQAVNRISSIETFENFTGFGLYDRRVIDILKTFNDPYPYTRGQLAEIGLPHKLIPYTQPRRWRGITKNNFYSLYDMAMLGITNLSKVPLRLVTFTGFVSSILCILVAFGYFIYKLLFWNHFDVGIAPLVIGIFFFSSVQLVSLGIIGEYIGSIHTRVNWRPYVVELERVNFEHEPELPQAVSSAEIAASNIETSEALRVDIG